MDAAQQMVQWFHRTFGAVINQTPTLPDLATQALRIRLIREELAELSEAFMAADMVLVADALADLLYVVYGTAVSCGLDMAPIFAEVHRSNMSKVGGYRREDGKWIKPDTYSPADLAPLIWAQEDREE